MKKVMNFMKKRIGTLSAVIMIMIVLLSGFSAKAQDKRGKVLFIGDSMTGWLAERLNAYGEENGFDVATVVWDSSTISKWGSSPKMAALIEEQDPDAVFLSLGMNELFEANPAKLKGDVDNIKAAIGDRPMVWVGPPSWPGHDKGKVLNDWLENEIGEGSFYRSFGLDLPRQSAKNPHPTRQGMIKWMDEVVEWLPEHSSVKLNFDKKPAESHMSRGKVFIYRRGGGEQLSVWVEG
ncbi:MAG: hypothetical protein K2K97_08935, partial [Muribaculaceae bacterium]|nr:hypothetical protein [Muribaculaceae bacterium]